MHRGVRLVIGNLQLQAADGLILLTLSFFTLLTLLFSPQIDGWFAVALKNVAVGAIFVLAVWYTKNVEHRLGRFLLRTAAITLLYAYLFGAVDKLQLLLHGEWLDYLVLDFEQYVFGVQPTLWLQEYTTPWLTEWMMFSYVIYVPLYPILCGIIYYRRGELPMEEYFFTLGLTNVLCDIGFILFPVASPMHYIKELYTVPLDGYLWTTLGEMMRSYLHFAGGSIPSPHAAAATIMWVMAYRYHRPSFYVMTPIVLSLYVSTFYGRYHYVTDAVIGVLVAALAVWLAPRLLRLWDNALERRARSV